VEWFYLSVGMSPKSPINHELWSELLQHVGNRPMFTLTDGVEYQLEALGFVLVAECPGVPDGRPPLRSWLRSQVESP
jgi:hypothetical protein